MRIATATPGNLIIFALHFERNRVSEVPDEKRVSEGAPANCIPAYLALRDAWACLEKVEAFLEAHTAANPSLDIPQEIPFGFEQLIDDCKTAVELHGHRGWIAFERVEDAYLELKHHIVFLMMLHYFDCSPRNK